MSTCARRWFVVEFVLGPVLLVASRQFRAKFSSFLAGSCVLAPCLFVMPSAPSHPHDRVLRIARRNMRFPRVLRLLETSCVPSILSDLLGFVVPHNPYFRDRSLFSVGRFSVSRTSVLSRVLNALRSLNLGPSGFF